MKIIWLRCFLAVERYRNFSTAADSLFMTQSALSKQIQSLEKELEVQLFDRSTHTIKLTQAGEKIVLHAKWIVGQEERMLHDLADMKSIASNKISLAAPYGMSYYDITDMVISFERDHPGIVAETHEKDHDFMMYSLDNHIVDFCIGYQGFWPQSERHIIYPLLQDNLVIVMSKNHPLSSLEQITIGEAQNEMFCLPREESGFFNLFIGLCNEAGFYPRLTLSDVRISTIKRYLSYGMRLTVTSNLRASIYFQEEHFLRIPIRGAPIITLALAARNERLSSMHQEFIVHAQNWYAARNLSTSSWALNNCTREYMEHEQGISGSPVENTSQGSTYSTDK